jgi:hypothetical protein
MTALQSAPSEETVSPLNPLSPRGALILLYWVFFKPSALRRHVAALAPELAYQEGLRTLWHAWRHPTLGRLLRRSFLFTLTFPFILDIVAGLLVTAGGGVRLD